MKCPIGQPKTHCQNCYYSRKGKCDWERIHQKHKANPDHRPPRGKEGG
ncbi:unnamed protein product [marine sediment metagenome]|uniref:Uncharacterized protein n=1 Tax=marine sediment metagenome TaxID=412755 RepID=X1SC77_9ZZZZ